MYIFLVEEVEKKGASKVLVGLLSSYVVWDRQIKELSYLDNIIEGKFRMSTIEGNQMFFFISRYEIRREEYAPSLFLFLHVEYISFQMKQELILRN